jgi:hypothetical protein
MVYVPSVSGMTTSGPSGVVDHSDVIEHPGPTMVRSSTATAALPKRASPQLQT